MFIILKLILNCSANNWTFCSAPCIRWGPDPDVKGKFWGGKGQPIAKYRDSLPWVTQRQFKQWDAVLDVDSGGPKEAAVHTWQIRLNRPYAAAIWLYVKLLGPLVITILYAVAVSNLTTHRSFCCIYYVLSNEIKYFHCIVVSVQWLCRSSGCNSVEKLWLYQLQLTLLSMRIVVCFIVVFMGSQKYPNDNDFDVYVSEHGGSSNAFTDCEQVNVPQNVIRRVFR